MTLKRTSLYKEYSKNRAKTIKFGKWELPVQFTGIMHEHKQTRKKATLFDVSHMGEITILGKDSLALLQKLVTNDVAKLTPNKIQYSFMCNENGGTIDDFLIYMINKNHYMLVVNATNVDKDLAWIRRHGCNFDEVVIRDDSDEISLLAIQGPKAEKIVQKITVDNITELKSFSFKKVHCHDLASPVIVSRTGYTGEDGFELYVANDESCKGWNLLLEVGAEDGLNLAGLGARDTLRLEAGLPLYGQELSETISPIEAGMQFAVKIEKEADFIGKDILKRQIEKGTERKIVGIEMIDKGIPRTNYDVYSKDGEMIGKVTSGTRSPTLQKNIGLSLIKKKHSQLDTIVWIQVRKQRLKAKIVKIPFYRREVIK